MLMLDLYAGRQGASQAMHKRGWDVISVDNNPEFGCTHTADMLTWSWQGARPDLVWLSPPCTEFARESMPWSRTGATPDLSLVLAGLRVVAETAPRFWVLENVRGAGRWLRPILGPPRQIVGPFWLWGDFPPLGVDMRGFRHKESYPSNRPDLRAMVPYTLSLAIAVAVESQGQLFEEAA